MPKGLRSFDEHDADFFLELLPGPRDRHGLPESLRFWKSRIEQRDPDKTFRVGLIYGPSGCGKSSLVKAGLLPRLNEHVLSVLIEATAEDTETRLLKRLRKVCAELPAGLGLIESLAAVRKGRILRSGRKLLVVLDQFEQWLHGKQGEENAELITALRQCDGEHLQVLVLMRDDFWLAMSRFMADLEVELSPGQNIALVDLFAQRHARKVLTLFGGAYATLPERSDDFSVDHDAFLDQVISGLTQDGKIVPVRLALFAEMVKERSWTTDTLREIGGTEGVGVTFLEETFCSAQANPKHRLHQKAAQAVLKALLPETDSDIRGQMRSEEELRDASATTDRRREFGDLMHILDNELRLITPTDPESSASGGQPTTPSGRYYQLTHDYLVHSLRDWLTRKQRETRRGRAALRLAERSTSWDARRENRYLPSLLEWANIRLITRKSDWTGPQRTMMGRAGWVHGSRTLAALVLLGLLTWGIMEGYGSLRASSLVESLRTADTADVLSIVRQLDGYRRWANHRLQSLARNPDDSSREKLHASLALVPIDASQLPYLEKRLVVASPTELIVIREALKSHRVTLVPKLWSALESAEPGDISLLPEASALADYDATNERWELVSGKVAQALIKVNPVYLGSWLDALRPFRTPITNPVAAIYRNAANLLMDADPKTFAACFHIVQYHEPVTSPVFQAEIDKEPQSPWHDPPLDPSWTTRDAGLEAKIESAQGMLTERFAFCQSMPMEEFLTVVEELRKAGYRPIRFRPYSDGKAIRVAGVWTRDGRPWRHCSDQSLQEIRHTHERNRKDGYLPVEVAGYAAASGKDGKPTSRFAALWVQRTKPDEDASLVVASTAPELTEIEKQLEIDELVPLTLHAWRQENGKLSYSGVWHKTATLATSQNGLTEADLRGEMARHGSLIDFDLSAATPPPNTKNRATAALVVAEATLKAKPNDEEARLAQASAHLDLGENQKAIEELDVIIKMFPKDIQVDQFGPIARSQLYQIYQMVAIVHARLGHKDQARADLERFQKTRATERSKLYLGVIVAAELGDGIDKAFESLEAALEKQPQDSRLQYDAACAYALASQAIVRKHQAKGRELAERAIHLLRRALETGYADYRHMQEHTDLDPIRQLPAFGEIMNARHLERSYAVVWSRDVQFEALPLFGIDPSTHLQRCRELASQGYRMVSLTVARTSPEGSPVTASVWHRPAKTEATKDQLAERQARAAIALLRMGKTEQVMPLLRHSADPRLRSFIINWLKPLEADPKTIAAELDRIRPTTKQTPSQGQQFMDAVLFHPETSQRRALILALGTYGTDGLSPGEREPLISKLLDLYDHDADAGIHGATEWTLRKWGQQDKLKEVDAQLMKRKDWGDRRWYVNGQGQTFALIQGPAEFRMGSPLTETERYEESDHEPRFRSERYAESEDEPLRRMLIPRRFAMATKEVTVEQFQRFLKLANINIGSDGFTSKALNRYSPDPQGPWIGVDWNTAAHYCNWLSEREGLPKDQWYYLPNEAGAYAKGMSMPADVLQRRGYRLPTEAEWEFACRAGALTSRYYGHSIALLGAYARYSDNSKEHAWNCGGLLPNDLGMFDMLGNAYEWCQGGPIDFGPQKNGTTNSMIDILPDLSADVQFLRGGTFFHRPAVVRSAYRYWWIGPATQDITNGFRPSRTYP